MIKYYIVVASCFAKFYYGFYLVRFRGNKLGWWSGLNSKSEVEMVAGFMAYYDNRVLDAIVKIANKVCSHHKAAIIVKLVEQGWNYTIREKI